MFPLPQETFPAMKFTPDQTAAFVDCRDRLLFATMRARHEFRGSCAMHLDQRMWKALKTTKETRSTQQWRTGNVTSKSDFAVYTPRRKVRVPRPSSSPTCSPILIGVGTVNGSLDDVMLGLSSTTTSAMRFAASTMHKDVLDARVLATLHPPTEDAPFESLGFKWTVKGPPRTLKTFVRPRDFVYLASTGIRVDARGQRVGHALMHSIELSNCPSLGSRFGIVRGALSFCYLFSESLTHPNRIDVFVRGFVDPRGCVSERVAISAAVDTIFACQGALAHARAKKVTWKVQADSRIASNTPQRASSSSANSPLEPPRSMEGEDDCKDDRALHASRCAVCRSDLSGSSTSLACSICTAPVCASCTQTVVLQATASLPSSSRQRSRSRSNAQLPSQTDRVVCCQSCIDAVERLDALAVARDDAREALITLARTGGISATFVADRSSERIKLEPIRRRCQSVPVVAMAASVRRSSAVQ